MRPARRGPSRAALLLARLLLAGLPLAALAGCGDASPPATTTSSSTASSSSVDATTGGGGASAAGAGGDPEDPCARCRDAETTGTIASAAIDEVSGVAASRLHDGVLFVHDDSGESARFFAIARDGADRGTFTVSGAAAVDWEDMAPAPCADGTPACLVLADTGDNDARRADVALYRVPEPAAVGAGVAETLAAEAFPFTYPDGPHDVEAVAVHPATGVVTLITKDVPSIVYELRPPLIAGMTAVRRGEHTLPAFVPLATGADVDPAGARLAVRTYSDVIVFPLDGGSAADALGRMGCSAPIAAEGQGEAVAWLVDGTGFVTVPEGARAPIHLTVCD